MKKPDPRPHQVRKTDVAAYRFGSGRAAETTHKKRGTERKMAKLPTSLAELTEPMKWWDDPEEGTKR